MNQETSVLKSVSIILVLFGFFLSLLVLPGIMIAIFTGTAMLLAGG